RGLEERGREHGEAPVSFEAAEQHPGRERKQERGHRQEQPKRDVRTDEPRERERGEIHAGVLRVGEADFEERARRGRGGALAGEYGQGREVLGSVLEGEKMAAPQGSR